MKKKDVKFVLQYLYDEHQRKQTNGKKAYGLNWHKLWWEHGYFVPDANYILSFLYEKQLVDKIKSENGFETYFFFINEKGINYLQSKQYNIDFSFAKRFRLANKADLLFKLITIICTLATLYLGYLTFRNQKTADENKVKIDSLESKVFKLSMELESTKKNFKLPTNIKGK